MIHLIIPAIPPSNNKFMGRGRRGNQYEYQVIKKSWHDLISLFFNQAKRELPGKILNRMPFEKSLVHITYYFPDKIRRDPDNYSGKILLDPLVSLGIIKDDSFKHVILKIEGEYDKENPRTEIRVTRLEGER